VIPILSLLFVLGLSLLVTRVATVALIHTGMGREAARFQARSAFTGVGFTTGEAEAVLNHPVRRRIVMALMLLGSIGIVSALVSLMVSVADMSGVGHEGPCPYWRSELAAMAGGLVFLLFLASSSWVDRHLGRTISWSLRRFTDLDVRDYASLLHLRDDYGVAELAVGPGDWIAGKTLGEVRLAGEGLIVLGVECPGHHFIGAPGSDTEIRAGDTLVIYGRAASVASLDCRDAGGEGDRCHVDAVTAHAALARDEHVRAER
jgi:hypothetical protein